MILWDPRLATMVEVLEYAPQVMHTSITCKVSSKTFFTSFVYGLHSVVDRRRLWTCLVDFAHRLNSPWIFVGDFNCMLNDCDRSGSVTYEVRDFLNCGVDLGLNDINSTGSFLTWSNLQIWSKIDIVMSNPTWFGGGFKQWQVL